MIKRKNIITSIFCFYIFVMLDYLIYSKTYEDTNYKEEIIIKESSHQYTVQEMLIKIYKDVADTFNIPIWVLLAISKQESNFDLKANYNGAYGIMQIQKIDTVSNIDLWEYHMNNGLAEEYKQLGYIFSDYEDMWEIYLVDYRVQIVAGAYIIRHYGNYVLFKLGIVEELDYTNNQNMNLIEWNSESENYKFKEILGRIFACYNGGPSYGMKITLDDAYYDYPNKVFDYCMKYREIINEKYKDCN